MSGKEGLWRKAGDNTGYTSATVTEGNDHVISGPPFIHHTMTVTLRNTKKKKTCTDSGTNFSVRKMKGRCSPKCDRQNEIGEIGLYVCMCARSIPLHVCVRCVCFLPECRLSGTLLLQMVSNYMLFLKTCTFTLLYLCPFQFLHLRSPFSVKLLQDAVQIWMQLRITENLNNLVLTKRDFFFLA